MEKMKKVFALVFLCAAVAALTFGVTWCAMTYHYREDAVLLEKVHEIYNCLDTYFVGDIDPQTMNDYVSSAMVSATGDQWSYYIPADEYESLMERMNNAYVGIGITIRRSETGDGFDILAVAPDTPAEACGLQVGDQVISVDGTSGKDLDMNDFRAYIREEGKAVSLTIRRGAETITVCVRSERIENIIVSSRMLDGQIGYITIANFNSGCAEKTKAAVNELIEQGAQGLVFDVRQNGGGLTDELVELLDFLLPEGKLFITEDYRGREHVNMSDEKCIDLPMAVLINENTVSAAEFFAAALREYGVAELIGTATGGKGYYQVAKRMSDGSALRISIGKYYTPNGISLAEQGGLTPDYTPGLSQEAEEALLKGVPDPAIDAQIQQALVCVRRTE